MKKSFKKAGAAVLSMSMLLAMGAVTMPVYAVDPPVAGGPGTSAATNTVVNPGTGTNAQNGVGDMTLPGAVYVSMPGMYKQGEGKDDTSKNNTGSTGVDQSAASSDGYRYDYLDVANVTKATVKIYKVAELNGTSGWSWDIGDESEINALLTNIATDGNGTALTDPTSFQNLLETDSNGQFLTKSSELQNLASYLERNLGNTAPVATKVLDNANQVAGFTLPEIDPSLMTGGYTQANAPGTLNKIGYYLITTTTDQAGVLVQPVLISLKNGQENPKNISLKGTTIDIAKRIAHVGNTDSDEDGIKDNHDTKIYNDDAAKFGGTSATVGKDDVVHYEIFAQLPKYDDNVDVSAALPFVIRDVASDGVTIDQDTIKVYVSQVDESADDYDRTAGTNDNWNLKGSTNADTYDYRLTMDADKHGFQIAISVAQMRGTLNTSTKSNTEVNNVGELDTMENCFVIVSFDATVDKQSDGTAATLDSQMAFDRDYVNRVTYDVGGTTTGVTLNTDTTATLDKIYADWVAYVDQDVTAGVGVKEAVLAAKAAKKYNPTSGTDYISDSTLQADAAGITNMFAEAPSGIAADLAKEKVIAMLLAIDHYNATRNGENNYASMTYGNNYSTGGNKARKVANDTVLTSVDMNLNKYVEKLTLSNLPDDITLANFLNTDNGYVTLAEVQAYATKNAATLATAAEVTSEQITTYNTAFGTSIDTTNTTNADVKAAVAMWNAAKTTAAANKDYYSKYTDEPVINAVFKLVYEPTGENKEIGYAVSTGSDGILKKLVATSADTAPTAQTTTIKYWEADPENEGKYIVYSLPEENAENAWAMLQAGTYELTEVYAPTGFKKWTAPVTITITALDKNNEDVTGTKEPDGAYKATGTSTVASEIASQQTEKTVPVNFTYYTNDANTKSNGVLQHKIYNEYQDTLPATGGIGTVLFTAGGISVVLIAGALFVMYMKKKNSEDEE